MRNRVLGIVYTHDNQVLRCASNDFGTALGQRGYPTEILDISVDDDRQKLNACLRGDDIAFCFGFQGIGSKLERNGLNLWQDARTPFMAMHYDNPCYNYHNHINDSPYVANLYHFDSFLDIQRRYLGGHQINGVLPFEIAVPIEPSPYDYADRPIKLLYLKEGAPLDEFVDYFNSLPPVLGHGVWDIVKQAQENPNLVICDLVRDLLTGNGYDLQNYRTQFWAVVQSIDFYLRRQRAIAFVEWLKFQPGAVIIGNGWDFIDRAQAIAEFRPSVTCYEITPLYEQSQIVCNTNPYGRDIVHERIVWGLGKGACVITDTNAWWDEHFADIPALHRFDWNKSLDAQLQPLLADPSLAASRAATARAPALKAFTGHNTAGRVAAFAEQVRAQNA